MGSAPVRRDTLARVASSVRRGTYVGPGVPGAQAVTRPAGGSSQAVDDDWVVVEPVSSIAPKGHAYLSFDPA